MKYPLSRRMQQMPTDDAAEAWRQLARNIELAGDIRSVGLANIKAIVSEIEQRSKRAIKFTTGNVMGPMR